jgi:hypothetical protein
VCSETGWQACHILARNTTTGKLIGAVPLYIKSHSYGEYVFDNSWARAHASFTGRHYYPKLQSCVPFTPVPGPRLLALGENDDERAGDVPLPFSSFGTLFSSLRNPRFFVCFPTFLPLYFSFTVHPEIPAQHPAP